MTDKERIAQLEAALRQVEWMHSVHVWQAGRTMAYSACLVCGEKAVNGHAADCAVGAALASVITKKEATSNG